jgi:amino acid transporter
MDVEILVPLGFFAMIAYIVKLISDNRLRRKVLNSPASEEMAEALLQRQWSEPRTRSALKWGLIFAALGAGVLVVSVLAIGFESPLAYAILLLATGAALLGYYVIERDDAPAAPDRSRTSPPASGTGEEAALDESADAMADPVQDPER